MKYICKECSEEAEGKNIGQIIQRNKVCLSCINKRDKERAEDRRDKQPKYSELTCKICGNTFTGIRAAFCSEECRSIGRKINKLEKQSSQIANLKQTVQVEVYGANKERAHNYIKEHTRRETK